MIFSGPKRLIAASSLSLVIILGFISGTNATGQSVEPVQNEPAAVDTTTDFINPTKNLSHQAEIAVAFKAEQQKRLAAQKAAAAKAEADRVAAEKAAAEKAEADRLAAEKAAADQAEADRVAANQAAVNQAAPARPAKPAVPAAPKQAPAPAAPAPAPAPVQEPVTQIYVGLAGGQGTIDQCAGPVLFTGATNITTVIAEHDGCGGWARFSSLRPGQVIQVSGVVNGTFRVRGNITFLRPAKESVIYNFGSVPSIVFQTCIPGTASNTLMVGADRIS